MSNRIELKARREGLPIFAFCAFFAVTQIFLPTAASAAREPVLKQIDLPHSYYFREMFLPQLTSGPSSVAFSPDGTTLVYSMAGSLWRQRVGEGTAVELTHGPGYDYQPDWSRDGKRIVFVRHDRNSVELWELELDSKRLTPLTREGGVNLQPRYSPDGSKLAFVSTAQTGHFDLYVATFAGNALGARSAVPKPRESRIPRYYYSTHDHAINPSWTPDGKQLLFVSNHEIAYGSGSLCAIAVDGGGEQACFANEETSWRAQPEMAPDGRRVLYSSYQGRQWHQLWLTTLQGNAPLPLTFGEFDITQARWSPDGRRIAYVSNETGNLSLWIQDVVGGARQQVVAKQREYLSSTATVRIRATDADGRTVPARFNVVGSDARQYGPTDRWLHADDGFDPTLQREETRYFHCMAECAVTLPAGRVQITAWRGQAFAPATRTIDATLDTTSALRLDALTLPAWAPRAVTADLHVHMNYGGHYRHDERSLGEQAAAEDLDVVYNTIVNKEQRIPDIARFGAARFRSSDDVPVFDAQEYHTSYWGHLALLNLQRYLTPDFSAYRETALASPYPHNGVIADLAHAQGALVGYVHPYDFPVEPATDKSLTHLFPVDVALGKTDYIEIVGFSDHKATADVWYKLLNLGFRIPAGAGTDAMANYASLRGPVGMNRAYLHARGPAPEALGEALKAGRTVASNGPQLALQVEDKNVGDSVSLNQKRRVRFRAAMRSPAPIDRLELVYNGKVVASHRFGKQRTSADFEGSVVADHSGWFVLRAWSEQAHPLIFDIYPYATTSPVYVTVGDRPAQSTDDAKYFVRWIERVIDAANARDDYNDTREKDETLAYLREALDVFRRKVSE